MNIGEAFDAGIKLHQSGTDTLRVNSSSGQVIGRVAPDGTIYVRDPSTGEEKGASWEEAVAIFVKVCRYMNWEGEVHQGSATADNEEKDQ